MNRGTKILAATVVLGSGTIVALLFRQEAPRRTSQAPRNYGQLVLRKTPGPLLEERFTPGRATALPSEANAVPSHSHVVGGTTIVTPVASDASPPSLPRSYPAAAPAENSRWGTPIGLPFPGGNATQVSGRTHSVVDGDTLRSLAERYLGSPERYGEIFEANRQLLSDPEILPIGANLKIPSDSQAVSGS